MITIRRRRADEWTDPLTIWRTAVEGSHHFLTVDDIDFYERLVAGYLPQKNDLRVAERDGRPVAYIAHDNSSIHMLFVALARQGTGAGSALLADVADVAEDHLDLCVDVNEQNPSARAFYRSRGFVKVGRSDIDGQGRPFRSSTSRDGGLSSLQLKRWAGRRRLRWDSRVEHQKRQE